MDPVVTAIVAAAIGLAAVAGPVLMVFRSDREVERLRRALLLSESMRKAQQTELDGWRILYPDEGWEDDKHKTTAWRRG